MPDLTLGTPSGLAEQQGRHEISHTCGLLAEDLDEVAA
jgi:hypothetical protein